MNDDDITQPFPAPTTNAYDDIRSDAAGCLYWYQRPFAGLIVGDPNKVDPTPADMKPSRHMRDLLARSAEG